MKCVAVSDLHMREVITPAADLLIVAGDMTDRGSPEEMSWFADWLKRQPQKHKVWIAGNHELGIEETPELALRIARQTKSTYLNDSEVTINGVRIWGSPITPWLYDWAFNRHRGDQIRRHWELIPDGIDILITHGPPFMHHDLTRAEEHVGCEELADIIMNEMSSPPQFHIFGHVHPGYGRSTAKRVDGQRIEMINAASSTSKGAPINKPIQFVVLRQPSAALGEAM